MQTLSRQQLIGLVLLTLVWGINWPIMKLGVSDYPPLTFRMLSMWLGLPVLALGLMVLKVPFRIPRAHWRELFWLALTNMFVWHALIILAVKSLTSGRAAILGYSMPIFSALLGAFIFGNKLIPRAWLGVAAAALGVVLLLWHELTNLAGKPLGVMYALFAALTWALGMARASERRRARISARAGGSRSADSIETSCPTFIAAPRMRPRDLSRRRALASLKTSSL